MGMPWMETSSGMQWNPISMVENFTLSDLVLGVSRICRYAGQVAPSVEFYSVAEHLVLMDEWAWKHMPELNAKERRTIICHDLQEGLMGDMPRPMKKLIPQFGEIEDLVSRHLAERYDLIFPLPGFVKDLDNRIIKDERQWIMDPSDHVWETDFLEPLGVKPHMWLPRQAALELKWALAAHGIRR